MSPLRTAVRGARTAIKAVVHHAIAPFVIRAFRARAATCDDAASALALAEGFEYGRIRITPIQVRSEILALLETMAASRPRVLLEIGTANGGTLFLFTRVAAPDARLISVDLPGGPFGGGYPAWKASLYRAFARGSQSIELVRADSHDPATASRVASWLGGKSVDFLFIDGDHSLSGVRADFELYSPLVAPGGMIAFHDIVPGPESDVGGVPRFWQELKTRRASVEFVADWKQGGYGIGMIKVANDGGEPAAAAANAIGTA